MKPLVVEAMDEGRERARLYLGDGLYVSMDDTGSVWLRTERLGASERAGSVLHEVALEPKLIDALGKYVREVHALLASDGWSALPEQW